MSPLQNEIGNWIAVVLAGTFALAMLLGLLWVLLRIGKSAFGHSEDRYSDGYREGIREVRVLLKRYHQTLGAEKACRDVIAILEASSE